MRFHKLEMIGFKSFADKTQVTFQDGVTAVVGPNGCGKSNIADAIRWVLGEMSAKNLRGGKMEDVIFNGSDARKPMGMAEVNLTLQDVEAAGNLGFTEFNEITISRRLYRNGDSEYLINKIPCRRKDVRDLLMDTGMGSKAYSIIEQDKISYLVNTKPEERRFIIEEVAGITKYKTRKTEALSKLKETTDNLDRVNDIVHEVKRQIGSLDRQAKKAERYKKLSAELRMLELRLAWGEYNILSDDATLAKRDFEILSMEEETARAGVSAREAELTGARLNLAETERGLMERQREIHQLEAEAGRLEARLELAGSQMNDLDEREGRIAEERGRLASEEAELDHQSTTLLDQQKALKAELDRLGSELSSLESSFQQKSDDADLREAEIEDERGGLFELQARISRNNHRLETLGEQKSELEAGALKAAGEERETHDARKAALLERDKRKMELEAASSSLRELEDEQAQAAERLAGTKVRIRELEQRLAEDRDVYSKKSSRLQSLVELQESHEGCGEGVKALMSEKRGGGMPGVRALVADVLQTSPAYEKAVEAVLGERLQHVVVGGHTDARTAIEFLKERGAGRGTFIPASPRATAKAPHAGAGGDGVEGAAASLVKASAGYEAVVEALLGSVVVVRDLDTAVRLWEAGAADGGVTLVTLDGEVVEPIGCVSGGSSLSGGGLLSKKREMRELAAAIEEMAKSIEKTEDLLAGTKSEMGSLETRLAGLHDTIGQKRVALVGLERDVSVLDAEAARLDKKLEVLGIESDQRAAEAAETEESMARVADELAEDEEARLARQSRIEELVGSLRRLKEELAADREAITAKKVELSSLLERHESSAREIRRADLYREELGRKSARLDSESEDIKARREELKVNESEARERIDALMKETLSMKEGLPALQDAYESAGQAIAGLEDSVRASRRDAEAAAKALGALELRRTEIRLKMDHVKETVSHNYHIAMEDIDEDIKRMEVDLEEAEMNVSELTIKLERLGPVNVGAIEEYNELMERFSFLSTQKEDLEASVKSLKEAIGKINKTSGELFMEAFESVNETFKKVFESLFEGGRAELRLVPPESGDLLESGLEIVAQPPGKRLQSLTLFSGGEKALIAAALVFACFLVRTSPFCVLDEVDAPLDESNVQRFGNMLREFADKTQFIVITHARQTMEQANALYGVTMDEPGLSRLVSVRLKEAAELAAA